MSIYQKSSVEKSYPAYDIVVLEPDQNGYINLKSGDIISVGDKPQSKRVVSSVMSYALENGECPIKAHKRALELGHEIYYVMALGAMLSSSPQARETRIRVEYGQRVNFQGHVFQIVQQPNDNVGLKIVD